MSAAERDVPRPPGASRARLPLLTKILFGIGSTEDGAQLLIVGGVLLLYYSQILGLPVQWVSLAAGVSLFVDAFFDLLVAQISDNLRARLGRRHSLMYASIIPVGVSFIALWTPPPGLSHAGLFAWLLVCVTLFRFSHSLYMVPSGALLPELAPDYHDRTELLGYRYMLGAIGGAAAAVLTYGVFLRATPKFPQGQLNPAGYPAMAVAVAALMMATNLISCLGTHSRIPTLYRPDVCRFVARVWLAEVAAIFNNRNFLVALAAGMLAAMATGLTSGLTLYFSTFLFELPARNVMLLVATQALSAPFSFLLASFTAKRLGKRGGYLSLYGVSLIFIYGPVLSRLAGLLPPNGAPLLLPLLLGAQTVSSVFSISASIISTSMIADVIEENQAKTGRRSEGLVLFSDRLMLKLASALAAVVPGLLLTWVHFPTGAHPGHVRVEVMNNLTVVYALLGLLFSGVSSAVWLLFRIDRAAHAKNLAEIAQRKAQALIGS